ncbi:hypothetical protein Tco_0660316 [Tanacetum coccineum]
MISGDFPLSMSALKELYFSTTPSKDLALAINSYDKPLEANNEKTTADTEAESMVSITIHQDTSVIPPMTSPVIDLVVCTPILHSITRSQRSNLTQSVSGELGTTYSRLVDANQALEERLDKHGSRLYRLENQDIPNQVSKAVDEIVMDAVDWLWHAPP